MDDFDTALDTLLQESAEIVSIENELRSLSIEHKECTPKFVEKAKYLKKLLDYEYDKISQMSEVGLKELQKRINKKFEIKIDIIQNNILEGKDENEGIDSILNEPLDRLNALVGEIIEDIKGSNYESMDEENELPDDELPEDELPEDEPTIRKINKDNIPVYLMPKELIENPKDSYPKNNSKNHGNKFIEKLIQDIRSQNKELSDNDNNHKKENYLDPLSFRDFTNRTDIIVLKRLYEVIKNTEATSEKDKKFKKRLLDSLEEYKYIIFLKKPSLERLAAQYHFNISSIQIPSLQDDDYTASANNLSMSSLYELYNQTLDEMDYKTVLKCLRSLLIVQEYTGFLDEELLNNLLSYCEELRKILGNYNYGCFAYGYIKRKIKKNTNGDNNERRESN